MKPKHRAAIVAAMAAITAVTFVAAEKRDGRSEDGTYRLKSHGRVIAEMRVLGPAKMQVSPVKMEVGGGRTTWRALDASKTVTVRLFVDGGGQPVEFTAEEIELDREVDVDPNKTIKKK